MSELLKEQILEQVSLLPQEQQQRILDFARALAMSVPVGARGKELLRFAGAIEADELQMIAQATEHGCESLKVEAW